MITASGYHDVRAMPTPEGLWSCVRNATGRREILPGSGHRLDSPESAVNSRDQACGAQHEFRNVRAPGLPLRVECVPCRHMQATANSRPPSARGGRDWRVRRRSRQSAGIWGCGGFGSRKRQRGRAGLPAMGARHPLLRSYGPDAREALTSGVRAMNRLRSARMPRPAQSPAPARRERGICAITAPC
jgi:hypothetical protein